MVDVYLVIVAVLMSILMMIAVVLLIIVFGHPDDNESGQRAWIPKIVTAFGLWLAFISVLVLPFDVANTRSDAGARTDILWQILYMAMAIMLVVVIPYSFFYYESEIDPEEAKEAKWYQKQYGSALVYTLLFLIIFIMILVILYTQLNDATVPVTRIAQSVALTAPITAGDKSFPVCGQNAVPLTDCKTDSFTWDIPVTFPIYVMVFLSFIGWWFFTLFVGVGLAALPMDLINEFRTRPKPMKTAVYFEQKRSLGERAKSLIEVGEQIKKKSKEELGRSDKNKLKTNLREFEKQYYYLKQDYKILDMAHKLKGGKGNPLMPIFKLILGIFSIGISLSWLIHIGVFIFPPVPKSQFLNSFFIKLENVANGQFPLFGIIAYAIWSLFLLAAVVKGNFKLGVRFLIWKVYPMEINNTLMNAFLANTWVILLCSIPAVQFCVRAFPVYANDTAINMLFGVQAQYVGFFKYFWTNNVFIYILIILAGLTLIYLLIWPDDKGAQIERQLEEMAKEKPPGRGAGEHLIVVHTDGDDD